MTTQYVAIFVLVVLLLFFGRAIIGFFVHRLMHFAEHHVSGLTFIASTVCWLFIAAFLCGIGFLVFLAMA